MKQPKLFDDEPSGEVLRDAGIATAMSTANKHDDGWPRNAYQFLLQFVKTHSEFMCEDVRAASAGMVAEPPSTRAWGGIIVRARVSGLIRRKGFQNVKNASAHCTPATLWEVC